MTTSEYLEILDSKYGVSGSENDIRSCVVKLFSKFCNDVKTDVLGNVIGIKKGKNSTAPSLMIEAHMDELGLMVSEITSEGSLKFVTVGGFDPKVLPGNEVTVHGKETLFGIIGAKPPHLITNSAVTNISDLCVDIGFSEKETKKLVSVGDIITLNTGYTKLDSGFVAGRCIDDRGGLAKFI